jgi:glutaredoxin
MDTRRWTGATLLMLGLGLAGGAAAQVYKWKDAQGVTHFSDTPPPPSVAKVEVKTYAGGGDTDAALPYELAQAAKNFPVVLYTVADCAACDKGRNLLQARGIPYAEKSVASAADQAILKQNGGGNQLPFLTIGAGKYTGFESLTWDGALTAASYPAQSQLPATYRQPPARPAAPPRPAPGTAAAAPTETALPTDRPPPQNAPPDFQF